MAERGSGGGKGKDMFSSASKFAFTWIGRCRGVGCCCQPDFEEVVSSEVNVPIHQHLQELKVNEDVKSRCVSLFGSSSSSNLGYLPQ